MFSLKKWFIALTVVFFSGAAIAELSPDEVVKKTADDVISAIKSCLLYTSDAADE